MQTGYTMSNGKSDLHVHFHGGVGQGATLVLNVPSTGGLAAQLSDLKQTLLSKQELTTELATAIQLLTTKVTAVDNVVPDSTPPPAA